jgi:hypothetical protein
MDGAVRFKQQDMIRLTCSDFTLSVRSWGQPGVCWVWLGEVEGEELRSYTTRKYTPRRWQAQPRVA